MINLESLCCPPTPTTAANYGNELQNAHGPPFRMISTKLFAFYITTTQFDNYIRYNSFTKLLQLHLDNNNVNKINNN